MSLVGFKGRNHPQQVETRGRDLDTDDRATVPELFDPINRRYQFTIDVAAAAAHNAKCARFYDRSIDGLAQDWTGERVWCNPPYSDIRPWVEKAWSSDAITVMLLPANRTEQGWWQDLIEPHRDRHQGLSVEFLRGRIRFLSPGQRKVGPNERPPFGCCLVIWNGHTPRRAATQQGTLL